MSAGLFAVLGAAPALGRTFTAAEEQAATPVVVLSDRLWRRRFGGRPEVIGQTVEVDRIRHEIVGVMPPDFEPAYLPSELWTPLGIRPGNLPLPNATYIVNVVRLRPGVTLGQLSAEVKLILDAVAVESPQSMKDWTSSVRIIREAQFGTQRTPLLLLLAAVVALALIAAANLMNLTLTRVISRRADTALRLALGAGTADLVRAEVMEALLVAAAGGGAGLLLAGWLLPSFLALDSLLGVRVGDVRIDWRVVTATFGLSIVVTLVAAIVPVVRETIRSRATALADLGRRTSGSAQQHRTRALLVRIADRAGLHPAVRRGRSVRRIRSHRAVRSRLQRGPGAHRPTETPRVGLFDRRGTRRAARRRARRGPIAPRV